MSRPRSLACRTRLLATPVAGRSVVAGCQADLRRDRGRTNPGRSRRSPSLDTGSRSSRTRSSGADAGRAVAGCIRPAAARTGPDRAVRRARQEQALSLAGLVPSERSRGRRAPRGRMGPARRQGRHQGLRTTPGSNPTRHSRGGRKHAHTWRRGHCRVDRILNDRRIVIRPGDLVLDTRRRLSSARTSARHPGQVPASRPGQSR
jgi:hypothetical protein